MLISSKFAYIGGGTDESSYILAGKAAQICVEDSPLIGSQTLIWLLPRTSKISADLHGRMPGYNRQRNKSLWGLSELSQWNFREIILYIKRAAPRAFALISFLLRNVINPVGAFYKLSANAKFFIVSTFISMCLVFYRSFAYRTAKFSYVYPVEAKQRPRQ